MGLTFTTVSITVALNNNGITDNADWWLAAQTPFGLYFYTFSGWRSYEVPAYQGPLFYLDNYEVLSRPVLGLEEGTYTLYFGIDTDMDGDITWDSAYYDTVEVTVSAEVKTLNPPFIKDYFDSEEIVLDLGYDEAVWSSTEGDIIGIQIAGLDESLMLLKARVPVDFSKGDLVIEYKFRAEFMDFDWDASHMSLNIILNPPDSGDFWTDPFIPGLHGTLRDVLNFLVAFGPNDRYGGIVGVDDTVEGGNLPRASAPYPENGEWVTAKIYIFPDGFSVEAEGDQGYIRTETYEYDNSELSYIAIGFGDQHETKVEVDYIKGYYYEENEPTWIPINNGLTNLNVKSIAIDPTNPDTIYIGTGNGVFKSINGGSNWSPTGLTGLSVTDVVIDPIAPNIIYAGTPSAGVYKSTDSGNTWHTINSGFPTLDVRRLAIDPQNNSILYAGPDGYGIYKSTDGGSHWISSGPGRDVREFIVDPANPSIVYAATVQGILKTTNSGDSWFPVNTGVPSPFIFGLTIDPVNTTTLYAGPHQSGVIKTTNGGLNWFSSNSGIPASATVVALAVNPINTNIVYAGMDHNLGVFKSIDGGSNWIDFNNGLTDLTINLGAIAIDPINPEVVYVGTQAGGIFKLSGS